MGSQCRLDDCTGQVTAYLLETALDPVVPVGLDSGFLRGLNLHSIRGEK